MRKNRIHLRNVTLGQNLGQTVQVTSGLSRGDKLVNNPPAGLLEGQSGPSRHTSERLCGGAEGAACAAVPRGCRQ